MDEATNYTPLDTEKLTPKKKTIRIPNKVLIGLILFFTVGVGAVGFLLTRETFETKVPAQVEPTATETPVTIPTGEVLITETVTVTPELTATSESTLAPAETETPIPTMEPTSTEAPTPTSEPAAIGGYNDPTATPTEIVLVQATATPGEAENAESTTAPEIPSAGVATFSTIFAVLSIAVIFLGLVL
ncbi:hypothetical protein A2767_00835 [Candidatus Roizmanbacteria bacterium RIFCSPHIGHO2_01_FULL_35_10]|uniref:Uncharacterized protein n=1 Tax=Candidatus Roizmanbacteria bacterium RIFCSPLOWO2_01_FULL_35_13 TaxID=1802055 RepID=A0A1F7IDC6_9BACT|nr:MAG: hypothetical protein A2767_00835 [Candidatus Roizmanbacteria bacterium RIFCSPHIGHO2_01_FULL_35_10]OGK41348.1 MAG: hypothetical protein A3A74_03380 [Candidatus Roizmanbacteria bacterium RIFCSPLOWO2_01_FULL_35_13]